ncbi:DUF3955 domain-containing protein [Pseudoalteromonas spongiae]|uniref:DUF3955 domain-containing protein n=1 Tax=Pseudoalteromonas spongiae TaxID=298657 RepID=UPI003AF32AEC
MLFKKVWPAIVCFSFSLIAYFAYQFNGVTVDENGFLREAFFLIPISLSLFMLGSVLLVVFIALKVKAGRRSQLS